MIRCDSCRTLNDDNARSCTWCGTSLWLSGRPPTGDIPGRGPAVAQQDRQSAYTPPQYNAYAPPVPQPAPARHPYAGFSCPYCYSTAPPFTMQKISEAGWIVLVMMLLFCFPLFWIGLLMKVEERYCSSCRRLLG